MEYAIYRPLRPMLTIENAGGQGLGSCYSQSNYRITSAKRLSRDMIIGLARSGVIAAGQEFGISSQCDGKEEPAFHDSVPAVMYDDRTRKVIPDRPARDYRGQPYKDSSKPYWVYECWERTDSSG